MTHLNIQQGLNIEVVSTNLIKKLYEAALSVPEPLEGELDAAYMSGNLLVDKSYRALVEYLTNRFDDLHINITNSYYIDFEDTEVASVLLSTVSTDGIGVSEGDASLVTSFSTLGLTNNSSITSFDELKYFNNITSIPQGGLSGISNITKINLKNILSIGLGVFNGKTLLNNVGQTTNLRTIGKYAFKDNSSLHNIDLTGVTTIELEAFRGSGITDVNCPNLLNLNGSGNFQMSSVQTITDLGSVTILPDTAFWKCTSLTSVNIPNVVTIKSGVFSGCSSLNNINLSNVTSIGLNGFRECTNLTGALDLPNLTSLGAYSFQQSGITSIVDLGSITNVPSTSFNRCSNLTTVVLPNTCTTIKDGAFAFDTSMTSIDLGGTTTVEYNAFMLCTSLTTITGMSLLTAIGSDAFLNCPITGTLNLPNLTSLGNFAFSNCKFSTILSLGTISSLAEGMFGSMTNLTSVTLPSTLRTISWGTFNGSTSLTKLIIPEGVTSIINQQPNLMTGLIYIEVPSTVTDMLKCFHRFLEQNLNESVFMVIKAENPPALAFYNPSDTAGNNMYNTNPLYGIYVPNVTTYQNASGPWQSLKILSKLKPISQLQTDNPTLWADYLSRINQS